MKKILERLELETVLGGIFGVITLAAIITEVALAGFETAAVVGGIKDFFGTLITVVMLVVAIKALIPKKKRAKTFQQAFDNGIERLQKKYDPIFQYKGQETSEKWNGYQRYDIASKPDGLVTGNIGTRYKFFYIKEGERIIEFSISATVFGERKHEVAALISKKISEQFSGFIDNCVIKEPGFILILKEPLSTSEDAKTIIEIIDQIVMLYLVEYKK